MKANNNYLNNKLITAIESDNLGRFFADIKRYQSLTKPEEMVLIKAIQKNKDVVALDKLIKANLRFVVTVAKTYQNQGVPLLDLIQEGASGMVEAAHRFDVKRDVKFFSYAVWWIKIQIMKGFDLNKRLIQLPVNRTVLIIKIRRKSQELEDQLQRQPTILELRKHFPSQSEEDLAEAFAFTLLPLSLQAEMFQGTGEETQLGEMMQLPNPLEIDADDTRDSMLVDLNKVMYQLPQLNYDILVLAMGLNEEPVNRLDKLAYLFELDVKMVTRIKGKAIKFLRKYKDQSNLNEYL